MQIITASPLETEDAAARVADSLRAGDILALRGDLGVGKTAFVRGLARGLLCPASVSSPTFALAHEYTGGRLTLYHFDMYRVLTADSLDSTGFFDYLDQPDAVAAIEWSENIAFALEDLPHIVVLLENLGEDVRRVTITDTKTGGDRF